MRTTVQLWTVARGKEEALMFASCVNSGHVFHSQEIANVKLSKMGIEFAIYPITLTIEVGEPGQPAKKGGET